MNYNKEALLQLSLEEKIALVGDLWDSIEETSKQQLIAQPQREFIERRLSDDITNPEGAIDWDMLRNKYPI